MGEDKTYNVIAPEKGVPIKAWTKGVPLEDQARAQLLNVAQLPFILVESRNEEGGGPGLPASLFSPFGGIQLV